MDNPLLRMPPTSGRYVRNEYHCLPTFKDLPMTRIIHAADLHISVAEKDYSLKVLDSIIRIVQEGNAKYLLFAGDIFDSFADAETLTGGFP